MPPDLAQALGRFLGTGKSPLRAEFVQELARATVDAWRDGLITTQQALRILEESREAVRALER